MLNNFSPETGLYKRKPDFNNLLKVLNCDVPARPTLFEFFMNPPLYKRLIANLDQPLPPDSPGWLLQARAFEVAGYDYCTVSIPGFEFTRSEHSEEKTISWNEGWMITDRESFDSYAWPDPDNADYEHFNTVAEALPSGMKIITCGPCGVLENVIKLVGYENLCLMLMDDEQLVYDIFEQVGSRLVEFYSRAVKYDAVGACISNDDWGFKTQTMLAPEDMRKFVFPWHKQIVNTCHEAGKPVILHSCGYFNEIIDDVIDDMKFDGRHSYEDGIVPVEEAYDKYSRRIAVMGGIDVDFICRHSPEEVYERSRKMLKRSAVNGAYALGSGNSIPEYVPPEGYIAMIRAALDE